MKKFFAWLFLISGTGNIIMFIGLSAEGTTQQGNQGIGTKLAFGIAFIILGIYLLNNPQKGDNNASN
ncbi:MAG: hypothetical protein EXR21_10195 [Flavobacteriaceae bacterium]|nr:hypothetical protein [Flavobacteriaceae bacterium]